MSSFVQAFKDGMGHIFCLDAMDHILFLLVLIACYDASKLKRVFWLVTAFTIGHGITFVLAALDTLPPSRSWAEMAIPITIGLTAILNFFRPERKSKRDRIAAPVYVLALIFGAIHGLAIGSMIQMKLIKGQSFIAQLIGFNLGIEIAQIIVVILILFLQTILMSLFRIKMTSWRIGASAMALGAALMILINNL